MSGIMTMMIDTHTTYWISFWLTYNVIKFIADPCDMLYVEIWTLQVGHSWLHLRKLSLMHLPQKRWLHSGLTSVSVQGSKQTAHSNSSSRNFVRDARTEDNAKSMVEQNWRRFWYRYRYWYGTVWVFGIRYGVMVVFARFLGFKQIWHDVDNVCIFTFSIRYITKSVRTSTSRCSSNGLDWLLVMPWMNSEHFQETINHKP